MLTEEQTMEALITAGFVPAYVNNKFCFIVPNTTGIRLVVEPATARLRLQVRETSRAVYRKNIKGTWELLASFYPDEETIRELYSQLYGLKAGLREQKLVGTEASSSTRSCAIWRGFHNGSGRVRQGLPPRV